jgi:hypothetical protein
MHHMRFSVLQEILEINRKFEIQHCSISITLSCNSLDLFLSSIVKFREKHLLLLDILLL